MRRGGGSRGGGSRGGSRSRGYRTNRRHHHRYRRGYRYRGGYYYGYNSGGVIIGIIIFVFIFLLVITLVAAAALGSPSQTSVNLGPGETRSFHPSQFWRSGVEVNDPSGVIETHFLDSRPTISSTTVNRLVNEQDDVFGGKFEFWAFYLIKGSTIDITWSSTSELEFWILEGNADFNSWKDGEDKGSVFDPSISFSLYFEAAKSTDYYFIFNNLAFSTISTVQVTYDITSKVHDISNSKRTSIGSLSESSIDEEYIVLYNPSSNDVTFQYIENPRFSIGLILLVEIAIIIGVVLLIKRSRKSKKAKTAKQPQTAEQYAQSEYYNANKSPTSSTQTTYNQRPQAKFCTACGSGILPNSEFCTECGTRVKST